MKKKVIMITAIIVCVVALLAAHIVKSRPIHYYYGFPYRKVTEERRGLARSIYDSFKNDISRMLVAEDSRSGASMRFAFISDDMFSAEIQKAILDKILAYLNSLGVGFPYPPHNWEVFFCCGKQVYGAYVSTRTAMATEYINYAYSDWYEVPDVENTITYKSLVLLMKSTEVEMYNSGYPMEESTPQIPLKPPPLF
jgi:hypothetical protein